MTGDIASPVQGFAANPHATASATAQGLPPHAMAGGYPSGAAQPPVFTREAAAVTQPVPTGAVHAQGSLPAQTSTSSGLNFAAATPQGPAVWTRSPVPTHPVHAGAMGQFVIDMSRGAATSAPASVAPLPPMASAASDVALNLYPSSPSPFSGSTAGANPPGGGMYASAPQLSPPQAGTDSGGAMTPPVAPEGMPATASTSDVTLNLHSSSPVHALLHGYFIPYMNIANQHQFHALIQDRTQALEAMGHGPGRIARNMQKGDRLDWLSTGFAGGVKALPFGGSAVVMNSYPEMFSAKDSPAAVGAQAGATAATTDVVGTAMLTPAISDTRWLHAAMGNLAPPMQQAIQEKQPEYMQRLLQNMALLQPYNGRNVVRTFAAPAMQAWGGQAVRSVVDTALVSAGGVLAGAATEAISRGFDKYNGLDGPALLFGRNDWEQIYRQLDAATWSSQTANGLKRASRVPVDMVTGLPGVVAAVVQPSSVAEIGMLAGGFSVIETTRDAVKNRMRAEGYPEAGIQAADQFANTVMSAPLFTALIPVMTGANELGATASRALHENGWTNRRPEPGAPTPAQAAPAQPTSVTAEYDADDPTQPLTGGALPFGIV